MRTGMISLIVPIYNTERYLRKCVDSIIAQTYSNLQIILVNDGSPDDSLKICREYEQMEPRIVVVDKPNGGLSSARNAGIKAADGEFIGFVDSDDFLEPDAYSVLMHLEKKTDADIIYMGCNSINEDYIMIGKKTRANKSCEVYKGKDFLKEICRRKQGSSVCGGLFKRWIFESYQFDEARLNEDYLFNATICLKENLTVVLTKYCGYNYYFRLNSISRQGLGKSSIDAVYNGIDLKKLAIECNPELAPVIGAYAAYQARTAMLLLPMKDIERDKRFIHLCRSIMQDNLQYFKNEFPGKKDALFTETFVRCPLVAIMLSSIWKKLNHRQS